MTITYPLSLPSGIEFSDIAFDPLESVGVSESPFTFQTQVQRHQGQRWAVSGTLVPMYRDKAEAMIAWRMSLKGRAGTFLMGDPMGATPRGTALGTPLADSGSPATKNFAGQEVLHTKGWTVTQAGVLKAGDWLQIGTGTSARLYKVLTDANADGGGLASLDIWPRLRANVTDGTAITKSSAKGVFRMAENRMSWSVSDAMIYGLSFSAVEAF